MTKRTNRGPILLEATSSEKIGCDFFTTKTLNLPIGRWDDEKKEIIVFYTQEEIAYALDQALWDEISSLGLGEPTDGYFKHREELKEFLEEHTEGKSISYESGKGVIDITLYFPRLSEIEAYVEDGMR